MLANVAKKFQEADWLGPGNVIQETRWIDFGLKIKQSLQLLFDPGNVRGENFFGQQLTLLCLAARVADRTSGAAREGDRMVTH